MEPTAHKLAKLPLTEWSALMLCMEHWNYIGEWYASQDENFAFISPVKLKAIIALKLNIDFFPDCCECCEYITQQQINSLNKCNFCLLWPANINGTCSYHEYGIYKKYPCKETALAIAYLAEEALDRIENDK